MSRLFLVLFLGTTACVPIASTTTSTSSSTQPVQSNSDFENLETIKTVQLHRRGERFNSSAISIGTQDIILEFDDLQAQQQSYFLRIDHRNADWSESSLRDLDYMNAYNEFPINQAEFSIDGPLPYVHYTIGVPQVKLPGNYLLEVYRNQDKSDVIFTRRLMVYQSTASITMIDKNIGSGSLADQSQQLNFILNYKNLQIVNPQQDLIVCIRQNSRWDNMKFQIPATTIRELDKQIEFRPFEEDYIFKAGNEYRFFDIRSLLNPGRNVYQVDRIKRPAQVILIPDKPRQDEVYSQYLDQNGNFWIDNYDYRDNSFAQYIDVIFSLRTPKMPGELYLSGSLTNWQRNEKTRMEYDDQLQSYIKHVLLKQGHYDYQYVYSGPDSGGFPEGNYFQTENTYEILVYQKSIQPFADLLIGYLSKSENPR